MSQSKELTQAEAELRFKKANAAGFINHMVAAAGATQQEAVALFHKSDQKANQLMTKKAAIRESIIAELNGQPPVEGTAGSNLPDNLSQAIRS